jgi:hypothetical protein
LAKAAAEKGVPYTFVTGLPQTGGQHLENALATPLNVMVSETIERFDAVFTGAGDTLSAALAGLLAMGDDLEAAAGEALGYLDGSLDAGFRPGMGHAVADRLFWAHSIDENSEFEDDDAAATAERDVAPARRDGVLRGLLPAAGCRSLARADAAAAWAAATVAAARRAPAATRMHAVVAAERAARGMPLKPRGLCCLRARHCCRRCCRANCL